MSTTNLFVELIVIGVGVFIWLMLLTGIISPEVFNYLTGINIDFLSAIPVIAIIYVMGIISDKSVDSIFYTLWEEKIRKKIIKDKLYYKTINAISTKYPDIANKLEYIRSRIRIIRSWVIHFIMIAVTFSFYISLRCMYDLRQKIILIIFSSLILICFSILSFYSWHYMSETYFKKIKNTK